MCLEQEVSIASQQIPESMMELDVEEKEERIGAVIAQLQHENAEFQDPVHPDTPTKKVAKRKSAIEDFTT